MNNSGQDNQIQNDQTQNNQTIGSLTQWQRLKNAELVDGNLPAESQKDEIQLWYVRILQGFAGWLAAVFILGFLGIGVAGLFEYPATLLVLGVVIHVSVNRFYKRRSDSDFFDQLVLAFSLTGQFLVAFGLLDLFDHKDREWLICIGLYQVVLVWFIDNYLHRFISTWFAVMALFWGFDVLLYSGLGSSIVAAFFVWIWLDKVGWQANKAFYETIGYALAYVLLQLNIHGHGFIHEVLWYRSSSGADGWLMNNSVWLSALLNSVVLIFFVYRMIQEQNIKLSSTTGKLIILAAVLMLFSALPVMGLSSALLILLVGYARQNRMLMTMGVVALIGFVSWYYYSLAITLLQKSMILMGIGVVMLLGSWVLKKLMDGRIHITDSVDAMDSTRNDSLRHVETYKLSSWQKGAAVMTLLLGLIGVNTSIWQKEHLLATGKTVYLELAPVDPRSIMQGDYMRLRFAIANEIRHALPLSSLPQEHMSQLNNRNGFVWVSLTDNQVGTFHSLAINNHEEQAAQLSHDDSMLKLQYRIRNDRIQFATNAFFFQEGDAKLFDAAKFGQFKVADDGTVLLTAMFDEQLKLLGHNRMD